MAAVGVFTVVAGTGLAADRYEIEPGSARASIFVKWLGVWFRLAEFTGVQGELVLDPEDPEASAIAARVAVASIDTGQSWRDRLITGPKWLDAATYPDIVFHSSAVDALNAAVAEVSGEIQLKGVSGPVTLTSELLDADPDAGRAAFTASGEMRRSVFGLNGWRPMVADRVRFEIEARAVRAEPARADATLSAD
ncbi:MAG: YceI family protein [Maricaulaceae bacterium]